MLAFFLFLFFVQKPPSPPGITTNLVTKRAKKRRLPYWFQAGGGGFWTKKRKMGKTRALFFGIYSNHHGTKSQCREICTVKKKVVWIKKKGKWAGSLILNRYSVSIYTGVGHDIRTLSPGPPKTELDFRVTKKLRRSYIMPIFPTFQLCFWGPGCPYIMAHTCIYIYR